MKLAELNLIYEAAHVRMNSLQNIDSWTPDQILASFATLKSPAIPLESWCMALSLIPDEIAEDKMKEQNAAVVEAFKKDPHIKVSERTSPVKPKD